MTSTDHALDEAPADTGLQASEPWVTIDDGAEHAGVAPETLREWIKRGWVPAARVGRVWRLRLSAVDAFLWSRCHPEDAAPFPTLDERAVDGRAAEIVASLARVGSRHD